MMDRMPIACVHCAKAKAKCDKKVPCTRCVGKQISCQSRATRRSSQHTSRRNNLAKPSSDRNIRSSAIFHVAENPRNPQKCQQSQFMFPPGTNLAHQSYQCHNVNEDSSRQLSPIAIAPTGQAQGLNAHLHRGSIGSTPPEMGLPATPIVPNATHIETYFALNDPNFDLEGSIPYFNLGDADGAGILDFDPSNTFWDCLSLNNMMADPNILFLPSNKPMIPTNDQLPLPLSAFLPLQQPAGLENAQTISLQLHPTSDRLEIFPFVDAVKEPEAVLNAQIFWPFFQCNELDKQFLTSPKTAHIYLEGLSQTLRNPTVWPSWSVVSDSGMANNGESKPQITTKPLADWSREKLLAVTQGFLHKALDIHGAGHAINKDHERSTVSDSESFLMLPPSNIMQLFLQNYVARYEPYYPSVAGAELDPNMLMQSSNVRAAALTILLMTASGAAAIPAVEARLLASGLTEACRLSLFDTIEKDVLQAKNVSVLRSAFLFTSLAAWSGDKWHMDMAMGQRGLYLAMLSHSGILKPSNSYLEMGSCRMSPCKAWDDWKEYEGQHRLAHSWIALDQEMSLFSDTVPLLSIVDLHTPIPDSAGLWDAASAGEWLELFEQLHGPAYQSPPSVRDMFTKFVEGTLVGIDLSPVHMRLLLHPLHAHVCQIRQFISCLPDTFGDRGQGLSSKITANASLGDLNVLLNRWYTMCSVKHTYEQGTCWSSHANLILYHLITLNTMINFRNIEQFARRDIVVEPSHAADWLRARCIDQKEPVYVHCGQILRLSRLMPEAVRPPWWAGAIYRVALILWTASMAYDDVSHNQAMSKFAIDATSMEHETIVKYLEHKQGTAALVGADGVLVTLTIPTNALLCCTQLLSEEPGMRLTEGIWRKLHRMIDNWVQS